ncbi:hypothetical protein BBOR36S_05112 [Brevibacillus borstelensis]
MGTCPFSSLIHVFGGKKRSASHFKWLKRLEWQPTKWLPPQVCYKGRRQASNCVSPIRILESGFLPDGQLNKESR